MVLTDYTLIGMSRRCYDDVITTFPVHWFWSKIVCLQFYNFIISHLILMRLNRIDHTLIEINSSRYDDVISSPPFRFTDFGRKKHGLACESQFHRSAYKQIPRENEEIVQPNCRGVAPFLQRLWFLI